MVSRKYANDYRLENTLGTNGKIVTVAVYNGMYFRFPADGHNLNRARVYITVSCAVYWLFFWLGLYFDSGAMRQLYFSIPYFCGFLPAAYLTSSVYYLLTYTRKTPDKGFTREQKDRIFERLAQSSISMLILSGLSAVGLIVYYALGAEGFKIMQDSAVILSVLVMLASTFIIFIAKKHTKMQSAL